MHRLWRAAAWTWLALITASASLLFSPLRADLRDTILSGDGVAVAFGGLAAFALVTIRAYIAHRRHLRDERLARAFDLVVQAPRLQPEALRLFPRKPGQAADDITRPLFDTYIPRRTTRFGAHDDRILTDADLAEHLRCGVSFILIGAPTEGKSRTLYEVIRRLAGVTVIRPRRDYVPEDRDLQTLGRSPIVLLIDDLSDFSGGNVNVLDLVARLRRRGVQAALAIACRNAPELSDVERQFAGGMSALLGEVQLKLAFVPLNIRERTELWLRTQPGVPVPDLHDYPTPGMVCMGGAMRFMHDRFVALSGAQKDCLRAIQLLMHADVTPVTHERVAGVFERIFGRVGTPLEDVLPELEAQGFISNSADRIRPEAAYVRWRPQGGVTAYRLKASPDDDLARLGKHLAERRDHHALLSVGVRQAVARNSEEALEAFASVITGLAGATDTEAIELRALAMLNRGAVLTGQRHLEQARSTFDAVLEQFSDATQPALRFAVAKALLGKGITLELLERIEEAITSYTAVVRRFGSASDPELRELVVRALYNKAVNQGRLGRSEEALATYAEVDRRFGSAPEAAFRVPVAMALFNQAVTLGQLGRAEEELAAYAQVVRRFADVPEPDLREQVAKALLNTAAAHGRLSRPEKVLSTCVEVVERFGGMSEPALREHVAQALVNKAVALGQLRQLELEIATYTEIVQRFGDASALALRQHVATALAYKGSALSHLGRSETAVEAYAEVVRRFGDASELALRQHVATALVYKGSALSHLGRPEAAVEAYAEVVRRFGDASELALLEQVALALVDKSRSQKELGRPEEALSTCADVVRRFGGAPEPTLRIHVAKALLLEAIVLGIQGHTDRAIRACQNLVERMGSAPELELRKVVGAALELANVAKQQK